MARFRLRMGALAAVLACSDAQTAFVADLSAQQSPVNKVIIDSFGSSHAATTLRASWRQHFVETKQDIPFNHVRFHGLLDDDMSTLLNGQPNPTLAFDTLDFLLANGVRPTVELSFMPEALATDPTSTVFHYKGGISPPKDWAAWQSFVTGLLRLFVARYGVEEVREWRFEVWNEPNCGFYYQGSCCGPNCGNQTAYFQLYQQTAAAVKAVDPLLPVGGPSTAQLGWIPEFLAYVKANSVPIDFVSSHLYPTDPAGTVTNHTRDGFMRSIGTAAGLAKGAGVPFLLTEFNAGLGNNMLDRPYAGSFVLHHFLTSQSVPNLASMSYWTFTDSSFEESGIDPTPWDNKFGIRTATNVPKPVYHAFTMLGQMPGMVLPVNPSGSPGPDSFPITNSVGQVVGATSGTVDVTVAAVSDGPGLPVTVTALLLNYNISDAPVPSATAVTITFTNLPSGGSVPSAGTVELVDDAHGNGMAVWTANGKPTWPNATEIAQEQAAALLVPQPITLTNAGAGSVTVSVTLQPYAFARVKFQYQP